MPHGQVAPDPPPNESGHDVGMRRLLRQHLWGTGDQPAAAVLRKFGAMQAQEFAYARWSLAQRSAGETASTIDRLYADGVLLRTHVLRPTWHFVHRADAAWLLQLTAPRVKMTMRSVIRQWGLDEAALRSGIAVLGACVADGSHRTRDELATALEAASLPSAGPALGSFLMAAELDRVLISGTPRVSAGGTVRHTYAAFEARAEPGAADGSVRIPSGTEFNRTEALRELVIRYFGGRAPATAKDCSLWSGLTLTDVREGLREAADLLTSEEIGGQRFVIPVEPLEVRPPERPVVDLIQCYDEFVMGYTPTRFFGAPPLASSPARLSGHLILLNGQVAGGWKHSLSPREAVLDIVTDRPFDEAETAALDNAVRRYGDFLGRALKVWKR
ncbi:winged helix DNA-binding domain-containing protein [Arthrobacter tecti]